MNSKCSDNKVKELEEKPIKKVGGVNDWAWWALLGAVVLAAIIAILKISGKI